MTTIVRGHTYVDAPAREPARAGIFSATTVQPLVGDSLHGVRFPNDGAFVAELVAEDLASCIGTTQEHETTGFDYTEGDVFFLYHAVECMSGFDHTEAEFEQLAQQRLIQGAQRAIEHHLWESQLPAIATDMTPAAGAVDVKHAMGILTEWAGAHYTYVPTLHFGHMLAPWLVDHSLVKLDEDEASAIGGALPVNGSGYTSLDGPLVDAAPLVAGENERWLYITGQIGIWEGDITAHSGRYTPENDLLSIAERPYIITVDGNLAAAIRVKLD